MIPSEILHYIAKAIGLANGHPDPDGWAATVVQHAEAAQAAPAADPSPAPVATDPAPQEQPPST